MSFFAFPLAMSRIFFACMMDATPIVMAFFGTSSMLAKKREFASIVLSASDTVCVSAVKKPSGSLNPI